MTVLAIAAAFAAGVVAGHLSVFAVIAFMSPRKEDKEDEEVRL